MESMLQPPQPFVFENDLKNVTSGNLSKEWEKWKSSFMIYYEACELHKKDKKVQINILLHIIGEKCREVYEQVKGEYGTIEGLLKAFDGFFLPRKNITIERHSFFKREQQEFESVEQYVFELNKIARNCEFQELCNGLVRDRMICGIRDGALRERLLRESDLTLSKAVDICTLAERSRVQANNIKQEKQEHHVDELVTSEQQKGHHLHYVKGTTARYSSAGKFGQSKWRTPHQKFAGNHGQKYDRNRPTSSENTHQNNYQRPVNNKMCKKCGSMHRKYDCIEDMDKGVILVNG